MPGLASFLYLYIYVYSLYMLYSLFLANRLDTLPSKVVHENCSSFVTHTHTHKLEWEKHILPMVTQTTYSYGLHIGHMGGSRGQTSWFDKIKIRRHRTSTVARKKGPHWGPGPKSAASSSSPPPRPLPPLPFFWALSVSIKDNYEMPQLPTCYSFCCCVVMTAM
jgi:hypothetical protein